LDTNPILHKYWGSHYKQLLAVINGYGLKFHTNVNLHFRNCSIGSLVATQPTHETKNPTAVVTPSNSLSYMGGGFDKYLLQALLLPNDSGSYKLIEPLIQQHSLSKFNGYLPVNSTNVIDLVLLFKDNHDYTQSHAYKNWNLTTVIQVPSMIVPESILSKTVVFDFVFNVMITSSQHPIDTLIIPGIGTGYGTLDAEEISKIMIFSILLFNLDFGPDRFSQLKKSCLILFFFNKDYKKLANESDLSELHASVISDFGRSRPYQEGEGELKDFDELFKCIRM